MWERQVAPGHTGVESNMLGGFRDAQTLALNEANLLLTGKDCGGRKNLAGEKKMVMFIIKNGHRVLAVRLIQEKYLLILQGA